MKPTALVIAELKDATIRRVTLEAITVANRLLPEGSVHCFLSIQADHADQQAAARQLAHYGVASTYVHTYSFQQDDQQENDKDKSRFSVPALASLAALKSLIAELQPTYIVAGHTAYGRELAPRLAAALGTGYIADVTDIQADGSENTQPAFIRPIYAGKAFETRTFQGSAPHIITLRPNNHQVAERTENNAEQVLTTLPSSPDSLRLLIKETISQVNHSIDLSEADIIVSGGRGVRGSEGFQLLQQLADQLGGAVGASRAACDAGYCDYSLQIGQTGKVVTPQLYIACGISGAIQHLAGMSQSRTIVAINKDPEAPIFSIADYGIVGDLFEVVPLLIAEIQASRLS